MEGACRSVGQVLGGVPAVDTREALPASPAAGFLPGLLHPLRPVHPRKEHSLGTANLS